MTKSPKGSEVKSQVYSPKKFWSDQPLQSVQLDLGISIEFVQNEGNSNIIHAICGSKKNNNKLILDIHLQNGHPFIEHPVTHKAVGFSAYLNELHKTGQQLQYDVYKVILHEFTENLDLMGLKSPRSRSR